MTIFRVQKKENYVVLDKTFLNDKKLTWQAKGLLAFMLSMPNDWTFRVSDLTKRSKNGRDATNNVIKELVDAGYIRKQQKRADKGKFGNAELRVYEIPLTEKPLTDNPFTENPSLLNNNLLNNKKDNVEKDLDVALEVINYLNDKVNKKFKATSASTKKLINGRLSEGYELDDFKRVIDVKVAQWLNNKEMSIYLRPSTLFNATNFENYLNENTTPRAQANGAPIVPTPLSLDFDAGEDIQ